jgi:hypothetical protein
VYWENEMDRRSVERIEIASLQYRVVKQKPPSNSFISLAERP